MTDDRQENCRKFDEKFCHFINKCLAETDSNMITSVLIFHVVSAFVRSELNFDDMIRSFKFQWDQLKEIENKEKNEMETSKEKSKVKKVMKEFGENKLHSGSKKGPLVKDRKQGVAIALSEAGISKKKKGK